MHSFAGLDEQRQVLIATIDAMLWALQVHRANCLQGERLPLKEEVDALVMLHDAAWIKEAGGNPNPTSIRFACGQLDRVKHASLIAKVQAVLLPEPEPSSSVAPGGWSFRGFGSSFLRQEE